MLTVQQATRLSAAPDQGSEPLYVVTCRAEPESQSQNASLTLPGGDYQISRAIPKLDAGGDGLQFGYEGWQLISHRQPPGQMPDALPGGDVLIVVHGFNESEPQGVATGMKISQALERTGGITVALGTARPMSQQGALRLAQALNNQLHPLYSHLIAFTWPCAHRIFPGYLLDKEQVARFAAYSLANLLADLRAAEPGRRILLVAHSMGCFLTLKALNVLSVLRAAQPGAGESPVIVDQMVFYAADVNADALQYQQQQGPASSSFITRRRNGYGYQALDRVGRLTIYYSYHDNVLIWSPFANMLSEESGGGNGRARLGWCGPLDLASTHANVVAVDCSACAYDHGAYFVRHEILAHTAKTLSEAAPETPQPAYEVSPLPNTAQDAADVPAGAQPQGRAHRLWTWYTPAEIARERWERFFLRKPRWLRRLGLIAGTALLLAPVVGLVVAGVAGIDALILHF